MIIKITNGEVEIKNIYSRKTKKLYNKALSEGVEMEADQKGEAKIAGFSMESMDNAQDILLQNMVITVIIEDQSLPITIDTFDELNSADVDLILKEIDKIVKPETEESKKN